MNNKAKSQWKGGNSKDQSRNRGNRDETDNRKL